MSAWVMSTETRLRSLLKSKMRNNWNKLTTHSAMTTWRVIEHAIAIGQPIADW